MVTFVEQLSELRKKADNLIKEAENTRNEETYLAVAEALEQLGEFFCDEGVREGGAKAFLEASEFYEHLKELEQAAMMKSISGMMYILLNKYHRAAKIWENAAKLLEQIGQIEKAAEIYNVFINLLYLC